MTEKQNPFAHLRPSTVPEMLDRALVAAMRFGPLLWFTSFIFAADHLLPLFVGHLPEGEATTPAIAATILGLMLLGEYSSAVAYLALFQGMLFPLRPLSPKALLRTGLRKLAGYFIAHLLYLTAVAMVIMTAYGFFTARNGIGGAGMHWVSGGVAALFGLWLMVRLCLAPIASLIEDCNPMKAFARSWHLTSTRSGSGVSKPDIPPLRWLAISALPLMLSAALAAAVSAYAYWALGVRWPVDWNSEPVAWALNLFLFLVMLISGPLYWAGIMSLYVEYRMRHEALDFYLRLRERRREMKEPTGISSAKTH